MHVEHDAGEYRFAWLHRTRTYLVLELPESVASGDFAQVAPHPGPARALAFAGNRELSSTTLISAMLHWSLIRSSASSP